MTTAKNISAKLPAYTLMEMMVVMLLSAMVITIAFKSLEIVSQNYQRQKTSNSEVAAFAKLDRLISLDVSHCTQLLKTSQGFECRYANPEDKRSYFIEGNYILRQQQQMVDTFFVQITQWTTYFQDKETDDYEHAVDELKINFVYKEEPVNLLYKKEYGAALLMEYENQATL